MNPLARALAEDVREAELWETIDERRIRCFA